MSLVVGLDLGGSTLRSVVMEATSTRRLLGERTKEFDTLAEEPLARIAAFARELVTELDASWEEVEIVGIGLAGSVRDNGVSMATNISGIEGLDIAEELSRLFDRPVVADNDANIGALSEWIARGQSPAGSLALIAVGTGVGVGIISGGRLVRGHRGEAGEVGFLPISPDAALTIEDLAGGAALVRAYQRETGRVSAVSGREVLELASFDATAQAIGDRQVTTVGWLASAIHYLLDPELIVLGGGIGLRPGFVDEVRHAVRALSRHAPIDIQPSILSEQSVALGAAHLARLAATKDPSLLLAPRPSLIPPSSTEESA